MASWAASQGMTSTQGKAGSPSAARTFRRFPTGRIASDTSHCPHSPTRVHHSSLTARSSIDTLPAWRGHGYDRNHHDNEEHKTKGVHPIIKDEKGTVMEMEWTEHDGVWEIADHDGKPVRACMHRQFRCACRRSRPRGQHVKRASAAL